MGCAAHGVIRAVILALGWASVIFLDTLAAGAAASSGDIRKNASAIKSFNVPRAVALKVKGTVIGRVCAV